MIASPHFAQMRLVMWLTSSRFAIEARAVFESSPFLALILDPFRLSSVRIILFLVFPVQWLCHIRHMHVLMDRSIP